MGIAMRAVGNVPGPAGILRPGHQEAHRHIHQGHHGAHRHAGDSSGGGDLRGALQLADEPPGQGQADGQLAGRLDDLRHRGGCHVHMSLAVTPEGGQTAHAHHRRGQGLDAVDGLGVVHHAGQPVGLEIHDDEGDGPQNQEHTHSQLEGAPHLIAPALGVGLAHQLGQRHREPGGGDGEQDHIDVIGVGEVGIPLGPDDVGQGDFVEHADQLDDQDARRQDRRPAEEGILFLSAAPAGGRVISGHRQPP